METIRRKSSVDLPSVVPIKKPRKSRKTTATENASQDPNLTQSKTAKPTKNTNKNGKTTSKKTENHQPQTSPAKCQTESSATKLDEDLQPSKLSKNKKNIKLKEKMDTSSKKELPKRSPKDKSNSKTTAKTKPNTSKSIKESENKLRVSKTKVPINDSSVNSSHLPSTSSGIKKSVSKENINNLSINQLLKLGEGSLGTFERSVDEMSDSSESDWEEVKDEPDIPKEGVEVVLKLPQKQRKKKRFDLQAYFDRELRRFKREVQVEIHKVHLLCLIAKGLQINALLNSETLLSLALSVLPSKQFYPNNKVTTTYCEYFTKWFNTKFVYDTTYEDSISGTSTESKIQTLLSEGKSSSKNIIIYVFILMLRALGLKARLVISLQPLPLKPNFKNAEKEGQSSSDLKDTSKLQVPESEPPMEPKESPKSENAKTCVTRRKSKNSDSNDTSEKRRKSKSRDEEEEWTDKSPKSKGLKNDKVGTIRRRSKSTDGSAREGNKRVGQDTWVEIFCEDKEKWTSVDVIKCKLNVCKELEVSIRYILFF